MATVQSLDAIKVMTVRASAFDAVAQDGEASLQTLDSEFSGDVEFVAQTLSESERTQNKTVRRTDQFHGLNLFFIRQHIKSQRVAND